MWLQRMICGRRIGGVQTGQRPVGLGTFAGSQEGRAGAGPNMTSSRRVFMHYAFSSSDVESVTAFLGIAFIAVLRLRKRLLEIYIYIPR